MFTLFDTVLFWYIVLRLSIKFNIYIYIYIVITWKLMAQAH